MIVKQIFVWILAVFLRFNYYLISLETIKVVSHVKEEYVNKIQISDQSSMLEIQF